MVILQGGAAFAKTLFPLVGPLGTTTLRTSLAALMLLAVFRPNLRTLTRADWRLLIPYGLALGLMNLSFYLSLRLLPLGLAVTLEFMGPLLLSLYLSRRPADYLWVALAGLGIFLMVPHTGGAHFNLAGAALALLAGAFWVAYILIGGRVGRRLPPNVAVTAGMLVAALVSLPFGLVSAGSALFQPNALLAGLAVALLSSALPYTLELQVLRALNAKVFGVLMSMEPAIAALSGLVILHERLSPGQWAGLFAVMIASAGTTLTGKAEPHAEPEPVN
ncbi:EamA family transporter [Deinococcus cavernae]|uniref:EamA family transporter n=2 Tax=Deinococcus cavernae TaxID=2320857 RepID=A0A418VBM6_9DEIO|nr:EamA family transporter [Deinococcus cavernae]RJF73533.1 EamA family transporter [Deinococcus cavernae]